VHLPRSDKRGTSAKYILDNWGIFLYISHIDRFYHSANRYPHDFILYKHLGVYIAIITIWKGAPQTASWEFILFLLPIMIDGGTHMF
jgi:hypothetical protein